LSQKKKAKKKSKDSKKDSKKEKKSSKDKDGKKDRKLKFKVGPCDESSFIISKPQVALCGHIPCPPALRTSIMRANHRLVAVIRAVGSHRPDTASNAA